MPAFRCELRVAGLTPGDKYVFAVAAYSAEGKLIGGSVGDSTKPILASHPLPVLLTWAYLAQVSTIKLLFCLLDSYITFYVETV